MNQREQLVRIFEGESFEAGSVQSFLNAEGIEAAVVGSQIGSWDPHLTVVLVRNSDVERALRIMAGQGFARR